MIGSLTVLSAFSYSATASMNCISRNMRFACRLRLRPSSSSQPAPLTAATHNNVAIALETNRVRFIGRANIHSQLGVINALCKPLLHENFDEHPPRVTRAVTVTQVQRGCDAQRTMC